MVPGLTHFDNFKPIHSVPILVGALTLKNEAPSVLNGSTGPGDK